MIESLALACEQNLSINELSLLFPVDWIPQLDGMMGEDTDEDEGAIIDGVDEDGDNIIMMQSADSVEYVGEDDEPSQDAHQDQDGQHVGDEGDLMALVDVDAGHADTAEGVLMETSTEDTNAATDEEEHKDVNLLLVSSGKSAAVVAKTEDSEAMESSLTGELKQEIAEQQHHEGELLAAELLQQMHDQKPIIKEDDAAPKLADETDLAGESENKDVGLLDTLAQAAALQKVVAVASPVKREKSNSISNSLSEAGNKAKQRSDNEESSNHNKLSNNSSRSINNNTNSGNKWYTVGVIQGLTHTVSSFFDWTCDEEVVKGSSRRRRSSGEQVDGDKRRRTDVKNGSNGGLDEEVVGLATDSDGEEMEAQCVAMYNNQPLTLDNLPNFASMAAVRKMTLEPGTGYRFRVAAINNCGRGEWSEVSKEGAVRAWELLFTDLIFLSFYLVLLPLAAGLFQDVSAWFPRCTVRHQDHEESRRSTLELGGTRLDPG